MRNSNVFTQLLVRRFVRASRISVAHLPQALRLSASKRRCSGSTLKPFSFPRATIAALLFLLTLPALAAVREVGVIGVTVNDVGRELTFFTNTLPFELVSLSETGGKEQDALLGLNGARLRIATLRLGDERIT